jgi:hypothetical protein
LYNSRWLKTLASFALLGLVLLTGGATVADIPAGGVPKVAFSHCLEGLRQETGSVLPSQLADRDACAQLEQIDATRLTSPAAVVAGRADFALSSVAILARPATWRDAGAADPLAAAAATAVWGDAGAARPQAAAVYYTPGDDWMNAGASRR